VRKLAHRGDISGLAAAAHYVERLTDRGGREWDSGAVVRLEAVEALAGSASREATPALIEVLRDRDPEVRAAAVRALGRIGLDTEAGAALIDGVAGWEVPPYGEAIEAAVEALIDSDLEEVVEFVAVRLVRGEVTLQAHHASALTALVAADPRGDTATRWVADCVCLYCSDGYADLGRHERAEAVVEWLGDAARERVVERLLSGRAEPAVIRVAGGSGDPRVIDPLLALLGHKSAELRAAAATSLGRLRHSRAAEALIHATQDRDPAVRRAAAEAFDAIGMAAAIAGAASAVLASRGDVTEDADASGYQGLDRFIHDLGPAQSELQR
jgi:hypothetical protein